MAKKRDIHADYEAYKSLLDLWKGENPIKTTKLQVLLAVNALLVSAINVSGGFTADKWGIYIAGAIFSLIWTFSIGRTSLFQNLWMAKIKELKALYPDDPRFSILDTGKYRTRVGWLLRIFGSIPSHMYLLLSPFVFAIAWIVILVVTRL
jgi:hypothetical protein